MELLQLRKTDTKHDVIFKGTTFTLQMARYKNAIVIRYVNRPPTKDARPEVLANFQWQVLASCEVYTTFWRALPYKVLGISQRKRVERAITRLKQEIKRIHADMEEFDDLANKVIGEDTRSSLNFS
jgi:hypothetical protein